MLKKAVLIQKTDNNSDEKVMGNVIPEGYTFKHSAPAHRKKNYGVDILLPDSLMLKKVFSRALLKISTKAVIS